MAETPEKIDIHVDSNVQQQLQDLLIEKEQLLLRYKPGSRAVSEVEARINAMQGVLANGEEGGVRRRGPNPAHQELQKNMGLAQSDVNALNAKAQELRLQVQRVSQRQVQLISWEADYKRLRREVTLLEDAVEKLDVREQAERAEAEIAENSTRNVVVIDEAQPPTQGKSLKLLAALASIIFAGVTALCVGLMRVFTRKGLSTRRSTEKTIGLPVVGAPSLVKS
jgi:uncharacterized protein involved in exopolysaccharide biosynthesis